MSQAVGSTVAKAKPGFFTGIGCWASLAVVGASLFLFLVACVTPAMVFSKDTWFGYGVLFGGWEGLFLGQFAWFANPFWALSLLLAFFRRWILTIIVGGVAVLIAFDAFAFIGARVPLDEANVNSMIFQSYHIGFYFWLASLLIVPLGAVTAWFVTTLASKRVAAR